MKAVNAITGAVCALLYIFCSASAGAEDMTVKQTSINRILDEVTIIGHRRDPADVPGSVHVIDQEELDAYLQSDVMRVLRTVPGVYLQEEDGFGLRPNIGIRGSGLDRSARVALLEDGVLIHHDRVEAGGGTGDPRDSRKPFGRGKRQ